MLNVIGVMRVKNESRWIRRSIESILPCCQRVVVFDDHSQDDTPAICASIPGVELIKSPFDGLDESRDKNFLLDQVRTEADWVVMIDGDEILLPGGSVQISGAMRTRGVECLSMPVRYAWDAEDRIRVDGVYGKYWRQSAFRPGHSRFVMRGGANFHCGNVPWELWGSCAYVSDAPLLHLGYMSREDRLRKYAWYNQHDPNNEIEDGYRHIVQGDVPEVPADVRLVHAGPLCVVSMESL